jgi:hypothetical protein
VNSCGSHETRRSNLQQTCFSWTSITSNAVLLFVSFHSSGAPCVGNNRGRVERLWGLQCRSYKSIYAKLSITPFSSAWRALASCIWFCEQHPVCFPVDSGCLTDSPPITFFRIKLIVAQSQIMLHHQSVLHSHTQTRVPCCPERQSGADVTDGHEAHQYQFYYQYNLSSKTSKHDRQV